MKRKKYNLSDLLKEVFQRRLHEDIDTTSMRYKRRIAAEQSWRETTDKIDNILDKTADSPLPYSGPLRRIGIGWTVGARRPRKDRGLE